MKTITSVGLVITLIGAAASNSIWAFDDPRHHFGGGYYGNYGSYYGGYGRYGYGHGRFFLSLYYAYHPRVVKVPTEPPVYIQRQEIELSATKTQGDYWYYCSNPEGYYPHVR